MRAGAATVTLALIGLAGAGCGADCEPRAGTVCEQHTWYWLDSCGNRSTGGACDCTCDWEGVACVTEADPWEANLDPACHDRSECLELSVSSCRADQREVSYRSVCPELVRCFSEVIYRSEGVTKRGLGATYGLEHTQVIGTVPCDIELRHQSICVLDADAEACLEGHLAWRYICHDDPP